jgi:hypothetical protein
MVSATRQERGLGGVWEIRQASSASLIWHLPFPLARAQSHLVLSQYIAINPGKNKYIETHISVKDSSDDS